MSGAYIRYTAGIQLLDAMFGNLIEAVLLGPLQQLSYVFWSLAALVTVLWILGASSLPAAPVQLVVSRAVLHVYAYAVIPVGVIALAVFFVMSLPASLDQFLRYSLIEFQLSCGSLVGWNILHRIKAYSPRYLFGFTLPAATALAALIALSLSLVMQTVLLPINTGPMDLAATLLLPALAISVLLRSVLILLLAYGALFVRSKMHRWRGRMLA